MQNQKKFNPLVKMTATAMLSALAFVLMLLEFPLLPSAPYLKMDFGDLPAVLGGVIFGPVCGVMIELFKNLLELLVKGAGSQMGFGNLQNFIVGCAFVLPITLLYHAASSKTGRRRLGFQLAALGGSMAVMLVVGFFSNWVIAPLFFRYFMQTELTQEAALAAAWISVPFNLIKGVILSVLSVAMFRWAVGPVRRAIDKRA